MKSRNGYVCPGKGDDAEQPLDTRPATLLRLSVVKVEVVMRFVVVHTVRNTGRHVAGVFDGPVFDEVIGAVSDGSTILVLTASPQDARKVEKKLLEFID
jgi:arginine repressor